MTGGARLRCVEVRAVLFLVADRRRALTCALVLGAIARSSKEIGRG